jgi:chorismate mutase
VSAGEAHGAALAPGAGGLEPFRRRLDALDEQVARLLGERFDICREIARYKQRHAIPMMQPGRVQEVRARYRARGRAVGLPEDFTGALFELLIGATCKLEDELMAAAVAPPEAGPAAGQPSARGPGPSAAQAPEAGPVAGKPGAPGSGPIAATPGGEVGAPVGGEPAT